MKYRVWRKTSGSRDLLIAEFPHPTPALELIRNMKAHGIAAYLIPDHAPPGPPTGLGEGRPGRGCTFPECPLKAATPPPCDARLRVAAVIPAHNEESTVGRAVHDILGQTYPVDPIIVVNDCSTDKTADVLERLAAKVRQLHVLTHAVPQLRAGAVNCGLRYLAGRPVDLVMVADADSRFDRGLVEAAVSRFWRHPRLGGVCSTSGVVDPVTPTGSWLRRLVASYLWRYQRLDWAGFDASRTATWHDVQILHGLCSVFRLEALLSVGGYSSGHLLEDYDLTLKLKESGWQAMYWPRMKAWTTVPTSLGAFFRQRLRWMRGGVDILLQHGINRFTYRDAVAHLLFLMLFFGIVSFIVASQRWRVGYFPHPIPVTLAAVGFTWSLCRLRFVEKPVIGDILLRAAVVPELIMAVALSGLQLASYYLALFRRPQKW